MERNSLLEMKFSYQSINRWSGGKADLWTAQSCVLLLEWVSCCLCVCARESATVHMVSARNGGDVPFGFARSIALWGTGISHCYDLYTRIDTPPLPRTCHPNLTLSTPRETDNSELVHEWGPPERRHGIHEEGTTEVKTPLWSHRSHFGVISGSEGAPASGCCIQGKKLILSTISTALSFMGGGGVLIVAQWVAFLGILVYFTTNVPV